MPIKFIKSACVYSWPDRLLVHSEFRTTSGVYVASPPYHLLSKEAVPSDIAEALLDALLQSKDNAIHPKDWKAIESALIEAAGFKTHRAFMNAARSCSVELVGSDIFITPTRNGGISGSEKGFTAIKERTQKILQSASPNEIGLATYRAIEECA